MSVELNQRAYRICEDDKKERALKEKVEELMKERIALEKKLDANAIKVNQLCDELEKIHKEKETTNKE